MFVAFVALFVGLSAAVGALVAGPVVLAGTALIGLTIWRRELSAGSRRGLLGMLCFGVLIGLVALAKDWNGSSGWIASMICSLLFVVGLVLASSASK